MKMKLLILLAWVWVGAACQAPKAQYETSLGKKKLKYYNSLQFGKEKNPKKTF